MNMCPTPIIKFGTPLGKLSNIWSNRIDGTNCKMSSMIRKTNFTIYKTCGLAKDRGMFMKMVSCCACITDGELAI